jgi:hypothetical protein
MSRLVGQVMNKQLCASIVLAAFAREDTCIASSGTFCHLSGIERLLVAAELRLESYSEVNSALES